MERKEFSKTGHGRLCAAVDGSMQKKTTRPRCVINIINIIVVVISSSGSWHRDFLRNRRTFPTHDPRFGVGGYPVDRTGVPLTVTITIQNKKTTAAQICRARSSIYGIVIKMDTIRIWRQWHADSEFHSRAFPRGRQTTDANARWDQDNFPGLVLGRATHIHVHVYDASEHHCSSHRSRSPKAAPAQ